MSGGANALRDVRERYRTAYLEKVERWEALRTLAATGNGASNQSDTDEALAGREVGMERSVLGRIDLAAKSLENAWLFLAREDATLVSDPSGPPSAADAQMRIVEAQEQERSRLAREVHDGPAQALSNAIFQVEVVQRLLDRDEQLARAELKQLREVLTRELRGVRAYLSQLRPPLLADLGLSGAIREAADQIATALSVPVTVELDEGVDHLPETVEVVALRVIQEALQNARKHAQPTSVRVRMGRDERRLGGRGPRRRQGLRRRRSPDQRAAIVRAAIHARTRRVDRCKIRSTIEPESGNGRSHDDPAGGNGHADSWGGELMTAETDAGERRRGGIAADKIRILVVDDHALFRGGITNVLGRERDFDVVGEAADGRAAVEMAGTGLAEHRAHGPVAARAGRPRDDPAHPARVPGDRGHRHGRRTRTRSRSSPRSRRAPPRSSSRTSARRTSSTSSGASRRASS